MQVRTSSKIKPKGQWLPLSRDHFGNMLGCFYNWLFHRGNYEHLVGRGQRHGMRGIVPHNKELPHPYPRREECSATLTPTQINISSTHVCLILGSFYEKLKEKSNHYGKVFMERETWIKKDSVSKLNGVLIPCSKHVSIFNYLFVKNSFSAIAASLEK